MTEPKLSQGSVRIVQPGLLTSAWFEKIFDTWAWDIFARALFVAVFAFLVLAGVSVLFVAWKTEAHDGWFWLHTATRALAIINNSVPIVIVIARRRAVARLHGLGPKVVALAGTFLPLSLVLLPYEEPSNVATIISGGFLIIAGILMLWAWAHLGRSYSIMPEARRLSLSGPYRLVRHPLYLFEELNVIGIYLLFASIPATLILAVQIGCQLLRIENEERILSGTFPEYRAYQKATRKLIPGLF